MKIYHSHNMTIISRYELNAKKYTYNIAVNDWFKALENGNKFFRKCKNILHY